MWRRGETEIELANFESDEVSCQHFRSNDDWQASTATIANWLNGEAE